jgi:hypothetical protein
LGWWAASCLESALGREIARKILSRKDLGSKKLLDKELAGCYLVFKEIMLKGYDGTLKERSQGKFSAVSKSAQM